MGDIDHPSLLDRVPSPWFRSTKQLDEVSVNLYSVSQVEVEAGVHLDHLTTKGAVRNIEMSFITHLEPQLNDYLET